MADVMTKVYDVTNPFRVGAPGGRAQTPFEFSTRIALAPQHQQSPTPALNKVAHWQMNASHMTSLDASSDVQIVDELLRVPEPAEMVKQEDFTFGFAPLGARETNVQIVALRDQATDTGIELVKSIVDEEKANWLTELRQREDLLWMREGELKDCLAAADAEAIREQAKIWKDQQKLQAKQEDL